MVDDGRGRLADLRGWCDGRPGICAAAGAALLAVGGFLFRAATGERNLFVSILLAVVGAAVGAFGLLLVNEPIASFVRDPANRRRGLRLGLLGLALGLAVMVVAVLVGSSALAIVGAVVVLLALLAVNAWLVSGDLQTSSTFLVVGLVLLVVGPLLGWLGTGFDPWMVLGLVTWTIGVVLFKVGLPPWIDAELARRRVPVAVAAIALTVVGVGLLYLSSTNLTQLPLLFGLGLAFAGLSAVGIAFARFDPGWAPALAILAAGLVLLALGTLLTYRTLRLPDLTLLAVATVAAIGAWFVFRGEALIAVLLLGFVSAWVLVDRTSGQPADPNPEAELTILAFGDSYISGEGAPRYLEGTNIPGSGNNACRRAPSAYPYVVAERLQSSLIFLACSGAKTTNMDDDDQPRPLPDPLTEIPGGEDQIQRLLASYSDEIDGVDAVLVSIGGNDVYFGNIVQACLLPQTCAVLDRVEPWLANAREVEDTLVDTYDLLRDTVGADTPIVAVLYPLVVQPVEGCRIIIGRDEIEFVIEFTNALNDSIRRAAARAGINVYEGSVDAFAGRGLCDEDPATNSLHLSPTEGAFTARLSPANWVHGSMHPRADGHALIADGLVSDPAAGAPAGFLVDLLEAAQAGGLANPDPQPVAPSEPVPGIEPEVADADWVNDRLYETVGDLVPPVGLLLIGGLVAAFGVIKARIPLLDFLEPSNDRRRSGRP
jgi:lysophospholipase L1-like esterase